MVKPTDLIEKWSAHRETLERRQRVLLVEVNRQVRDQLLHILDRCGFQVTSAVSAERSLELLEGGQFQLAVISNVLIETDGLALLEQLRQEEPHLDVVLTVRDLSLELIQQAFTARVRDIIRKPITDPEAIVSQLRQVRRRCIDQQMRRYLMGELRLLVTTLDEDSRLEATTQLERRLEAYKSWLGQCNHVLVLETDTELRRLSDALFQADYNLETVTDLERGMARLSQGDINLLVLNRDLNPAGIQQLMGSLRGAAPNLDVVFISPPQMQSALSALSSGVSLYLPRVPDRPSDLVPRLTRILSHHRERRLLDNLVLELFQEVLRVQGVPVSRQVLDAFYGLIGRTPTNISNTEESLSDPEMQDSVSFLDEVLADVLGSNSDDVSGETEQQGRERRHFQRLSERRVVRFRPTSASTNTLALMGNFSEGGLFIRTTAIPSPGTLTELDFSLDRGGHPLDLSAQGRVAWVATDEARALGPGFGVKFVLPSDDLAMLLRRIIQNRGQ